jgi:glutathione S-transferase
MATANYRLVIGNKRYSSWSLRPWLILREAGLPFEETIVWLRRPGTRAEILRYSPSGKVPVLIDGDVIVWDSLAIAEYLAERHPERRLWPANVKARAFARAIAAEMHAGFAALRSELPMDFPARTPLSPIPEAAAADIARIVAIWREARTNYGDKGAMLFGTFTIADSMYAPVVSRFTTYGVDLAAHGDDGTAAAYCKAVLALPGMIDWARASAAEPPLGGA